jgi:hypothetical protein
MKMRDNFRVLQWITKKLDLEGTVNYTASVDTVGQRECCVFPGASFNIIARKVLCCKRSGTCNVRLAINVENLMFLGNNENNE